MSVVGFDVGNLNSFIAVARSGGIELVANEQSERSTPTYVSFSQNQRFIGSSAKSQVVTNAKSTVSNVKRLIGRKFDDPFVQNDIPLMPFEVVAQKNGSVGVKVQYLDQTEVFAPEQLYAMVLTQLKSTAEKGLGKGVQDCVISVPSFFTDCQRRTVLAASQIVGLNCLRLLNETTAVALSYGLYKKDLPAVEEKPRHVAFVDMGHSACQVSVCAFRKGKIKVLSTASDPSLGGRDIDHLLRDYFSKEFLAKYKVDASSKIRPWLRLLTESEKMKKLMSANATDLPLYIECFMNDKDVTAKINRSKMEELAADILSRLRNTLEDALRTSGLSLSDIFAVELVGGSTRIPAVRDVIQDVFKTEIFTTLNADEAVARGCAIQCAMLSPTFKVRDIDVEDATPYPISLSWNSHVNDEMGEMEIFCKNHSFPASKMLTLKRKDSFELIAYYKQDVKIPHTETNIGRFMISGLSPTSSGEAPKVKVRVRLNIHGILTVASASMIEEIQTVDEPQSTGEKGAADAAEPMDTAPSDDGNTESKENGVDKASAKDEPMSTDKEDKATDKENQDKTNESQGASESSKENETKDTQKKPKKRKITKDLVIESTVPELSQKELNTLIEKELELITQVKIEKDRSDAVNAVEEYVYQLRDDISGRYEPHVLEQDREKIASVLSTVEDWLYGEGEGQKKQIYVDKLAELKSIGQPVAERYLLHTEIPSAFEGYGQTIIHLRKVLDSYEKKDEAYSHIDETEMTKVQKKVQEGMDWLNKKMQEFHKTQKHETPAVSHSEIISERKQLENLCNPIVTKPKPKVEPPPSPEDKKAMDAESDSGEGSKSEEANSESEKQEGTKVNPDEKQAKSKDKKDLEMEID